MNEKALENCLMRGLEIVRKLFPNTDCTIEIHNHTGQPILACLSADGEKCLIAPTAQRDPDFGRAVSVKAPSRFLHLPLAYGDEILGSLELTTHCPETIQRWEQMPCGPLADLLAAAIFHARLAEDFQGLALRDPKTGIFSLLFFQRRVEEAIAAYRRAAQATALDSLVPPPIPSSVVVADIDGFGLCNRRYGHAIADRLLPAFADFLRGRLRAGDTLARLSGGADEFLFLLPDTDFAGATALITDLQAAVDCHTFTVPCPSSNVIYPLRIGFSFGVVELDDTIRDCDDVVHRASKAMYANKSTRHSQAA